MTDLALPTRRDAVRAGALGALALTSAGGALAPTRGHRPNIVFILADDLGYADVSCYGRRDYTTSAIDRLAAGGLRFMQAYANSAVCSATRTALITGRYQYRLPLGLEEPLSGPRGAGIGLPADHPTLPSLLRAAGYSTTLIGKWHLGALPAFGPLKSGYERFWGFRGGALDYFTHRGTSGKKDLWDGDTPIEASGYVTRLLGDRAVETIDAFAADRRPFLLSLHFNAPHWPWEGPGDEAEAQRIEGSTLRAFDAGSQRTYAQMVQAMDAQIGRVLDALDRHGLAENTIVIFTSDNGGERFADTWPFSGQKTELLEGGLRVPAIVRWPQTIAAGSVSEQVTISMDWMPTLLAAAGVQMDRRLPADGMDLGAQLRGQPPVERRLFWRYKANHQRAVREGRFKYLRIAGNSYLFDVVVDPLERANLKDRDPARFARLEAAWREWNATMLPEIDESFTEGVTAKVQADHIGAGEADRTADPGD